ncbi:MAG TPA: molybdopterin-dependent oxidoreductase [Ilumatobacteraceae bacterium]
MSEDPGDEEPEPGPAATPRGTPVGRRIVLGLAALGAAGIVTGRSIQDGLAKVMGPIENRDPTGLISMLPVGDAFRFYSVTGSVPNRNATNYRLDVTGLVGVPKTYTLADLEAMPQTNIVRDFQCVTGWRVPQVHWTGVRLSTILEAAQPTAAATALRFHSFDGTYTESLTLEQARLTDVIVALRMLGGPVSHDHGGPVRMYVAPMYGYKSTKWLSGIELTSTVVPGYWEDTGNYDVDGFVGKSNGRDDDPTS